jgi:hypothetical protein
MTEQFMDRVRTGRRTLRMRCRLLPAALGAGVIASIGFPLSGAAQTGSDLQREIKEMRQQYDAELRRLRRDYDARLRRLEARLKESESTPAAAQGQLMGVPLGPIATGAPPTGLAIPAGPAVLTAPPPSLSATANAFNPSIGVILNGQVAGFGRNPNDYFVRGFAIGDEAGPGTRGFSLNETELNFQASVDPYLFGNLTIAIEPGNEVAVEEAYLQTTSLPAGFTLRAGRFFSGIGYLNEQHAHVWDFVDQALPYRVVLNKQYGDDGVQLRWLAPTRQFLEFGAELFRGDAFLAAGAARQGIGTHSLFVHTGGDVDESSSYRTGVSWLHTKAIDRTTPFPNAPDDLFSGKDDTIIVDAVYKWAPGGNPVDTNFKLQGEFFARRERGLFNGFDHSGWQTGFYAQAIYQFMPRWRVGARYDEVHGIRQNGPLAGSTVDSLGTTPRRASAMLEYNTSEYGRFRLQYNRDWSRGVPDNQGFLQYIISLGAHGAHLF